MYKYDDLSINSFVTSKNEKSINLGHL